MEIALSRYILIKMHIQLLLDFVNVYSIRPGGQNKGELPVHHPGSLQLGGDNIPIVPLHNAVCVCFGGEDHDGKEKLEDGVGEHRVSMCVLLRSLAVSIHICRMYTIY